MTSTPQYYRLLQAFALINGVLGTLVLPLVARQVFRSELVVAILLQGGIALGAAIGLFWHSSLALAVCIILSGVVAIAGVGLLVALPVTSGMLRSTFPVMRGLALALLIPSVGIVAVCLLSDGLRLTLRSFL